jgi:hypothetical protein
MRQSLRKTLLWQGVGLLFYLAGMVLLFLVAVNTFLGPSGVSFGGVTTGDIVLFLVSTGLIVIGRVIGWKLGGDIGGDAGAAGTLSRIRGQRPQQSKLEELGYHVPPEEAHDSESDFVYEDGEMSVRCPECGATNEQGFDYCGNCSSRLPE